MRLPDRESGMALQIANASTPLAARLAYRHFLKTGRRLPASAFEKPPAEVKFNPEMCVTCMATCGSRRKGQASSCHRSEYDTSGTDGTYRVPDARVGKVAFDWTLTCKTAATPQVRGFFDTDVRPDRVIIVRPSQLGGPNSTYVIDGIGR